MDNDLERSHHHISQRFNDELQSLHQQVLEMGGLVQQQLQNALKAMMLNDAELAEKLILNDHLVNAMEVRIDENCTHILARRQPTAGDLRMVIAVIKTITDLERIGDEAERVARMALHKAKEKQKINHLLETSLTHLGNQVQKMLQKTLDAFARMDADSAALLAEEDKIADREYTNIIRQLITHMMEDPRTIPIALDVMWSARSLERIGDRSLNICEYIVYFVKGKDIRHMHDAESRD